MRILFAVPNVPSLIRPRPFQFIRRLSRSHEVTVVCLATNDSDRRSIADLRQACPRVEVFHLPWWQSLWNCLLALLSLTPLRVAYFSSSRLRKCVEEKVNRGEVDLVHAEHVKMIPMVEKIVPRTPAVLDAVDCITLYLTRQKSVTANPFRKLFIWTEWKKMRRYEAKAADHFDRLVISAAPDREVYPGTTALRQKIRVVPNGVDLDYFGFKQFEPQRNRLVFCAKLDYFPNEDAALYFSRVVWPQLMARRPELRLEIVGSRPSRNLMNLDGKDGIRVRGFVPDVRPFLGQAWVALCPIRIKAGSQFKILEAMAMGTPVVATPISCSGLDVEPGKHLLVAETPGGFAAAVEALLDDLELRETLVRAARGFVEAHHNWDHSVEDLLATYQDARATSGRPEEKPLALSPRP